MMKISVHFVDKTIHTGSSETIELDENGSGVWFHTTFDEYDTPRFTKFVPMHQILQVRFETDDVSSV